jgi:hypothetical protein
MKEQKDNLPNKTDIFFAEKITKEESEELSEMSHAKLLSEAFETLSNELDKHGNTTEFQELRKKHSLKLLKFWQNKIKIYQKAQKEGLIKEQEPYSLGNETISVVVCGVYEDEDSAILQINRHTKTEKDEVQITADRGTGIDEFAYPPTIKSEVKFDPGEAPDIYYKVVFRRGRISTFERALIHTDPNHQRPYIKDIRSIDCSIFGVEI